MIHGCLHLQAGALREEKVRSTRKWREEEEEEPVEQHCLVKKMPARWCLVCGWLGMCGGILPRCSVPADLQRMMDASW